MCFKGCLGSVVGCLADRGGRGPTEVQTVVAVIGGTDDDAVRTCWQ